MKPDTLADEIAVANTTAVSITPVKGLLILAGTVVVVGTFIALNYVLGIADYWMAFLFLLYWGMFEKMDLQKLPRIIIGALFGLLMGYLLPTLPQLMGPSGAAISLGATLLMVYALIMGWLPIAINAMAMLFLTVVTIPALQVQVNLGHWLIALAFGIIYFGGLVAVGNFIRARATTC